MTGLYTFLAILVLIPILDLLWLGVVASKLYRRELGSILRLSPEGGWSPRVWVVPFIYACGSLAVTLFALPAALDLDVWGGFLYGALLGLLIYGTMDLTNHALLKDWTLKIAIIDILWGMFLTGTMTVVAVWLQALIG